MDDMLGIKLNGRHTFRDMGLKWINAEIGCPEPVTEYIQIPGSSSYIDLMGVIKTNGEPILSRRILKFTFDCIGNMEEWGTKYSKVLNSVNGKECEIILDTDSQSYYKGMVTVNSQIEDDVICDYTITVDADPYKYDTLSSTDSWVWDSFNFQTGVILELRDIQITFANRTIRVPGNDGDPSAIPIIQVTKLTSSMTVTFKGKSYDLKLGRNRFPQIRVGKNEALLQFTGAGTVNIEYRRKSQ